MKNFLIKNWKTSLVGLSIFTLVTLYVYKIIDTQQFITIFATLAGIGFFATKDGDKTGVSTASDELGGGGIKNPPTP